MADRIDDLGKFLEGLRQRESGNTYAAVGAEAVGGRGLGAYQIPSGVFGRWAEDAGLGRVDWRDPQTQDYIARWKASELFHQYGSWSLVAAAWIGGHRAASQGAKVGLEAVSGKDAAGVTVSRYVTEVMGFMSEATGDPSVIPPLRLGTRPQIDRAETPKGDDPGTTLESIVSMLGDMTAGGRRQALPPLDQPGLETIPQEQMSGELDEDQSPLESFLAGGE